MTQEGHSDHTAVVLIHGSMMGSWVWDKVLPHLSHRSLAVDLPGRGLHPQEPGVVRLPDAARSVIDDIDAAGLRDVVLVGHSLGGVVAVAAAASLGSARARGLVFLSSVVPREGRSWVGELPTPNRILLNLILRLQRKGARAPERQFRTATASDLDDETVSAIWSRLVPEAPRLFLDPVSWQDATRVPRTYIRLNRDRDVGPKLQDKVISHLDPVDVIDVSAGHLAMIGQPREVAASIDRAASTMLTT